MAAPRERPNGYTEDILPFTATPRGQIVVDAKIDGRPAGAFEVDTGTSVNLITDTLVAKLALKPLPFPRSRPRCGMGNRRISCLRPSKSGR